MNKSYGKVLKNPVKYDIIYNVLLFFLKGKPMNTIKRIITFIMALTVMASMAVTVSAASSDKPEFMLALGDSITTGYGLEDYVDGDTPYLCDSYANMIAKALGLKGGESYINKAVNGATSTDLLTLLPEIENYLGYADLIIVTIGGNDLLQAIPLVASAISGKNVTSLEGAINVLTSATPAQFAALSRNTDFQTKIGAVLAKYAANIASVGEIIKKNAPEARVLFLKQYNPMKNVLGFNDFGNFADTMIASINGSMEALSSAYGFEILDAPSVINVNAAGLTNMLNYDIHPNAAGHVELAKLVASHLGVSLDPSENTTDAITDPATEPETEPETEPATEPETEPETAPSTDVTEPDATAKGEEEKKSGCASVIGGGAVLLISACALVVLKKKND